MERSNAIDFVTAAAPGLRDLLLIGKVYEIEARRDAAGRRSYDLIVLDAPPTGRIVPFLQAPDGVTEIVRVGPIKRQAGQIRQMLTDERRTRAVVVSLLEEMPVQEAVEGIAQLRAAGVMIGPVVANMVEVPRLGRDELEELARAGPAGLVAATDGTLDETAAADALGLAAAHVERTAMQASLRQRLAERTGQPVLELPLLARPRFGADELEILADVLANQVGEDGPLAATVPGWLDRDRAPWWSPSDGAPS
jgi:anion-transporting  ArsA/GET3 family ATPase